MQAVYYHVSRYVEEGQTLKANTKNNIECCYYATNCMVDNYDNFIASYEKFDSSGIQKKSGRDTTKWMCEAIFEHVRKTEYPDKPSRIWGLFLSQDLESAKYFKETKRPPQIDQKGMVRRGRIYCIEIPDVYTVHAFDMDLYTRADENLRSIPIQRGKYEYAVQMAREYWKGNIVDAKNIEYLVEGELVVGKQLQV